MTTVQYSTGSGLSIEHARMRDKHMDDVSLHTYIGTANLLYVTLVFGVRSGSARTSFRKPTQLPTSKDDHVQEDCIKICWRTEHRPYSTGTFYPSTKASYQKSSLWPCEERTRYCLLISEQREAKEWCLDRLISGVGCDMDRWVFCAVRIITSVRPAQASSHWGFSHWGLTPSSQVYTPLPFKISHISIILLVYSK